MNNKREEAEARAEAYVTPKDYHGLREKVKHGIVSLDEAIEIASGYSESIRTWLDQRKKSGVKVKKETPPKKKGKKKNVSRKKPTK
jgi:hypothetical protein